MKVLVKRGLMVFSTSNELADLREKRAKKLHQRMFRIIKNTMIAFFSFSLHKVFLNIPAIPK